MKNRPREATTLLDLSDQVIKADPDTEAFVEPREEGPARRISFLDWAREADGLASVLVELGVEPGDVVAIRLASGIDYAIAFQGIVRSGAIATGINPRLGELEVAHIMKLCAPKLTIEGALPLYAPGEADRRRVDLTGSDPVAIVWTGGTTGLPKGAWFDHRCMEAMAQGAGPLSRPGDRRLSPLPFAHVGYMTRMWDELKHRITTVVVPSPWTARKALAAIEEERVSVCQGVPTQYRLMFDDPTFDSTDTSSLRLAATGGSRVSPELVAEMIDKLEVPVVVRYASTEASLASGTRLGDPAEIICETVGRPNSGVRVRICDDHDTATPQGDIGNVQVHSRAAMRGYWNDSVATGSAITRDGWIRTGDLGNIDRTGNLRLVGRSSDMYIRGGYNVYPLEVENCLDECPHVAAVAVLGASVADHLGEIGVVFAVAANDRAQLDIGALRRFVKSRLADYKAPDLLVVLEALPLTSIGKVDKKPLQVLADEEATKWSRTTIN